MGAAEASVGEGAGATEAGVSGAGSAGGGAREATIRIVVSACLVGERVRWDGADERRGLVADVLARHAELIAVCPEVGIGMPVPREPIQLVGGDGDGYEVWGVHTKRDYTSRLTSWNRTRVTEFARLDPDAFVLKSRSPSCGLDGARVFETKEALLADDGPWVRGGRGLFAAVVAERFADRPVVDEETLATPEGRARFADGLAARGKPAAALAALRADLGVA